MAVKYNMENRAVKRIQLELKEMQSNPSDDFMSLPLEENIFEWQFAIRGPRETEFEGGIYHGLIQFLAEYPFKPPSLMLLTPNGRFETQTKIWLSISNHHPEHWQPSWSVRTALVALIAFMPTSPNGALGSLDYKKEERRALAIKSREAPPRFGTPERQKLIDEIHEYMLSKVPPPVPQHSPLQDPEEQHPESCSARGGSDNDNDNGWTQGSFTNSGEGSQDFRDVSYDNGGRIQGSFTNNGEGCQNFRDVSYNNGPYSGNGNIIIHKGLVIKALEDGAGGHYTIVL